MNANTQTVQEGGNTLDIREAARLLALKRVKDGDIKLGESVKPEVVLNMFTHLTMTYSAEEARQILVSKYPNSANLIANLEKNTMTDSENLVPTDSADLAAAVKAKVAKPKKEKAAKAPKAPKAAKPPKVKKEKVAKAPKEPKVTKMSLARDLYAKATDQSRKAMIDLFGKELGLSKAAASTYFYTVKG